MIIAIIPSATFLIIHYTNKEEWKPEIVGLAEFGSSSEVWDSEYPSTDDLKAFEEGKDYGLSLIKYSHYDNWGPLSGIQLKFSDGLETPFF